ncbi:TlpA disulfide reductase family protein [Pedobacter metabolipauper]|uniref:Thiol-disulfide isomerase/thioredoxin n=1 Tax=Pedobacter metabolipauper TaxID=425513 RepID=A0A4R6SV39_9SPHI|nr:TlpA disulfide reductase family protein [Pedobacter metabolipauper]TDQ09708.1 thiol-disulfide isomerase/thioredoxin [Pedobacter metabolipauper]
MKKTGLFIFLLAFSQAVLAQQYEIKATITGFSNGTKFYLEDTDVSTNIDSAIIQDNKFVMKGKLNPAPQSLWLHTTFNKKFYYVTLLIGNDKVTITGNSKDMPFDLTITGSKPQNDRNALNLLIKEGYKKRNQLVNEYFALTGDSAEIKGKAIWKVIGKLDSADDQIKKSYITKNLNSYESLSQLFYLKGKFKKDTLQRMYDSLKPEFKASTFAQRIGNYLKIGEILKEKDQMADFEAQDKDGKLHRLSDIKGKYILLDFSATYCGPCIESIGDLEKVSTKYADQLEVVTFSGDGGKETWLKGVNRDKPGWLSLWDGKGNYGETIQKYGVSGYPTFILINPQGIIVSKWSGFGKEKDKKGSLETKVDDLMAKK